MNESQEKNGLKGSFAIVVLVGLLLIAGTHIVTTYFYNAQFKVFYSLDAHENDKQVVSVIDHANRYVYFAIYYFSMDDIADALVRAKERGLTVWGIMDREGSMSANKSVLEKLREAGIPVEVQKHADGIMHIKAVVTDKAYASGSYNWTGSATNVNDEVLEVGTNGSVHDQYFVILKKVLEANK